MFTDSPDTTTRAMPCHRVPAAGCDPARLYDSSKSLLVSELRSKPEFRMTFCRKRHRINISRLGCTCTTVFPMCFKKDLPSYSTRSFENINFFIFYEIHGSEYHNRFGKIAFSVFAIMVTHAEPLATNPEVDGNPSAGSKNPDRSTALRATQRQRVWFSWGVGACGRGGACVRVWPFGADFLDL